ncbi:MAG: hypothetical protein IPJ20_14340 [Flammeovirgaceae bacterium]|nr:hypothetical protein [Flammeovirgaceae bacterium]
MILIMPGTLTITKGLVTVNADNQSRVYGVANPIDHELLQGLPMEKIVR